MFTAGIRPRAGIARASCTLLVALLALPCTVQTQERDCRRRTVLVNVVDPEGLPVAGFQASDFKASYRGKPVQVLSARMEPRPRRTVILLDASGSMHDNPDLDLALRVVGGIVSQASNENAVAFLAFAREIIVRVDFAQEPEAALAKLNSVGEELKRHAAKMPRGGTAIYDSIFEALRTFGTPQMGDTIYLVTDGGERASRAKPGDVEAALLASHVRLFVYLFDAGPLHRSDLRGLRDLSEATGGGLTQVGVGRAAFPEWIAEAINKKLRAFDRQARDFYLLDLDLPEPVEKRRKWNMELVRDGSKPTKNLTILYPQKLMPCGAAATK